MTKLTTYAFYIAAPAVSRGRHKKKPLPLAAGHSEDESHVQLIACNVQLCSVLSNKIRQATICLP